MCVSTRYFLALVLTIVDWFLFCIFVNVFAFAWCYKWKISIISHKNPKTYHTWSNCKWSLFQNSSEHASVHQSCLSLLCCRPCLVLQAAEYCMQHNKTQRWTERLITVALHVVSAFVWQPLHSAKGITQRVCVSCAVSSIHMLPSWRN